MEYNDVPSQNTNFIGGTYSIFMPEKLKSWS